MRTRQKQRVVTDTWKPLGCRTTPLEHWRKRKSTVEIHTPRYQARRHCNAGTNSLIKILFIVNCCLWCAEIKFSTIYYMMQTIDVKSCVLKSLIIRTASSEFGTYRLCEQRRFRRACASAQSRQNLRCSLIEVVSPEEPSDRKPDP